PAALAPRHYVTQLARRNQHGHASVLERAGCDPLRCALQQRRAQRHALRRKRDGRLSARSPEPRRDANEHESKTENLHRRASQDNGFCSRLISNSRSFVLIRGWILLLHIVTHGSGYLAKNSSPFATGEQTPITKCCMLR